MEIVVLLLIGAALYVWGSMAVGQASRRRDMDRLRALTLSGVDVMSGTAFEHYAAALLVNEGFSDVTVTPASGDGGVDIVASRAGKRYAIQAKRYKGTVSRRAVSDAVAGMLPYKCNASMVITSGRLSKAALEFARLHQCEVVDRERLTDWIMRFRVDSGGSADEPLEPVLMPAMATAEPRPVAAPLVTSISNAVPHHVVQRVAAYTTERYAGDYTTAKYVIEEGLTAYQQIASLASGSLPGELLPQLKALVAQDHPDDYSTQLYLLNEWIAAYADLQQLSNERLPRETLRAIMDQAANDHPLDYPTQLYIVTEQISSRSAIEALVAR